MKLQCCSAKDSFHVGSVGRAPGTLLDNFASACVLVLQMLRASCQVHRQIQRGPHYQLIRLVRGQDLYLLRWFGGTAAWLAKELAIVKALE